jgi:osmotically-inducible protein OsmY
MNLKRIAVLFAAAVLFAGCASTGNGEGGYFDDMKITAKVKSAIYNEPSLKVMDIGVKTDNQVVELTGAVKSRTERVRAAEVARKVQGVKSVKNDLKVQ